MFDSEFAAVSDAELIAAIRDGAKEEAAVGARRLAAIAELVHRRVDDEDERALWAFDPWDSAAAEVASALQIGHRRASGQMRIAQALRERLPRVAALYRNGELSSRMVSAITWLTHLVVDEQALALIDAAVAERATAWGPLSEDKLSQAIEVWIARYDPEALRRTHTTTRRRDFTVGASDDDADTTAVWGRLLAPDAAVLHRRVSAMAHRVCAADPRSIGERRADALGALAAGNERLACACRSPGCPLAGEQPKSNVVIRVIAEQAAVEAAQHHVEPAENAARQSPTPALMLGHGVLSGPLLAAAIRTGATIKAIRLPSDDPEPGYRPSAELAEFVRMRDMFCRFPGCDVPAERCDLDHTRPWPLGPTHASNLKCECRTHHLMKTFWTGIGGWGDVQLPDGTVIWTSPSGQTYTTHPGSRIFYPTWNTTTADLHLPPPTTDLPPPLRGLMMPRRKRSRAADNASRIQAERALNGPAPF
jgi:hypothetical protein